MQSRKTVMMNIFVEQEQRLRHREQTLDIVGGGEGGAN